MQLHYIEFDISGLLTNLLCSALSLVLVKAFQFSKLKKTTFSEDGGGRWGRNWLSWRESNLYYVCMQIKAKKKEFQSGLEPQKRRSKIINVWIYFGIIDIYQKNPRSFLEKITFLATIRLLECPRCDKTHSE